MSAWQVAALAGGLAFGALVIVVLGRLALVVASLGRSVSELRLAVEEARSETGPLAGEVRAALRGSGAGSGETANGLAPDGRLSGQDGAASGSGYSGLASPVIKAKALGTGTSHAARRLRQRWER